MEIFEIELQTLINKFSKENGSDTPDFILADYLSDCLRVYNQTLRKREQWYGRSPKFPQSLEEVANRLINTASKQNWHNSCARLTLGDLPKITPESLVNYETDRTPEERQEILNILTKKTSLLTYSNDEGNVMQIAPSETTKDSNTICFYTSNAVEILKLCQNGDILVKGRLIENDKEVVDGLREFLTGQGLIQEKK